MMSEGIEVNSRYRIFMYIYIRYITYPFLKLFICEDAVHAPCFGEQCAKCYGKSKTEAKYPNLKQIDILHHNQHIILKTIYI